MFYIRYNLAYRRFGKPGFLVYGTINPKVRKLVTMIYVKKVFRDRSNLLLKVKRTKNYKVNVTTIDILNIIYNIFLLFTKNQSRSTRKQLDVLLEKAKHGNNTPSNLHFSLDLAYSYRPKRRQL